MNSNDNRESLPVLAAIEAMERRPFIACDQDGCILSDGHESPCLSNDDLMPDCQGDVHQPHCRHFGKPISPRPVVAALLRDIAAGIRVLNTINGLRIPEELIEERANNIVTGLLGNYRIEETP